MLKRYLRASPFRPLPKYGQTYDGSGVGLRLTLSPWLTFCFRVLCRGCCVGRLQGPSSVLAVPGDRRAVELGEPAVPALQRAADQHAGRPCPLLRPALAFRPRHAGTV